MACEGATKLSVSGDPAPRGFRLTWGVRQMSTKSGYGDQDLGVFPWLSMYEGTAVSDGQPTFECSSPRLLVCKKTEINCACASEIHPVSGKLSEYR